MGQSIFHEGRTGSGVSERLDEDEEITLWNEIKYRIIGYPLAIFKMIRFVAIVFYHFTKAVWYGEVLPLRPQKKIIDHGEVIGYLDGDKAQSIGRKMALPFILLFAGARLLGLLNVIVYPVIIAQILVWFRVIEKPGEGFIYVFLVMAGVLVLSILAEIDTIFIHKRTIGLRDVISLLNLNRPEPKPDTTQRLYRDDDTLDVKVKRGLEEYVGKIRRE